MCSGRDLKIVLSNPVASVSSESNQPFLISKSDLVMLRRYGILAAISAMAALAALIWVQPQTAAGQTVLVSIVAALVGGVGSLLWRRDA